MTRSILARGGVCDKRGRGGDNGDGQGIAKRKKRGVVFKEVTEVVVGVADEVVRVFLFFFFPPPHLFLCTRHR